MKKFLIPLIALILLPMVMFGADKNWNYLSDPDSTWIDKGQGHYRNFYCDTATFGVTAVWGDSVVKFPAELYNLRIRSLNGAGDSGFVVVSLGQTGGLGIWHADSIGRLLIADSVGFETGDDWLLMPGAGNKYLYVRPMVGGTADSTCKVEIRGYR